MDHFIIEMPGTPPQFYTGYQFAEPKIHPGEWSINKYNAERYPTQEKALEVIREELPRRANAVVGYRVIKLPIL